MVLLSRAEETVLLAILGLGENAYGVSILKYIQEKTGIEWSLAQTYHHLKKLVKKGYLTTAAAAGSCRKEARFDRNARQDSVKTLMNFHERRKKNLII